MQRCISLKVSFQEFLLENYSLDQCFDRKNRVLLASNMENALILVIPNFKVNSSIRKVVLNHLMVILGNSVVDWQITIKVLSVQLWTDFIHNASLTRNTHNVLDGLPFVVLLASGNVELVRAREPIEDLYLAFSSANE